MGLIDLVQGEFRGEAALNRIAYFYANPPRARLIDTVEQYPRLSSYQIFSAALLPITAPH